MDKWLAKLGKERRVLDLGSGAGSFDYSRYQCSIVAADTDFNSLSRVPKIRTSIHAVDAESHRLPFRNGAFSLILCNNSMEHFPEPRVALAEIGRVLESDGMLIITVPNGYGFDDNLYRYLLEGGGHVNRFRFDEIVGSVEELTGARLVNWRELYSSYVYLRKPLPEVLPHLRDRFRKLARYPAWVFHTVQFSLNVVMRFVSRIVGPEYATYGWAFFFRRGQEPLTRTPGRVNVCMRCGAGSRAAELKPFRLARFFYRCPSCKELNPYFKPRGMTE